MTTILSILDFFNYIEELLVSTYELVCDYPGYFLFTVFVIVVGTIFTISSLKEPAPKGGIENFL